MKAHKRPPCGTPLLRGICFEHILQGVGNNGSQALPRRWSHDGAQNEVVETSMWSRHASARFAVA
jgi:hypothetical protein